MRTIQVRNLDTGKVEKGIPTPRLAEVGEGEAFYKPSSRPIPTNPDGVWYLHEEPLYVSPDGKYTRVRVEMVTR